MPDTEPLSITFSQPVADLFTDAVAIPVSGADSVRHAHELSQPDPDGDTLVLTHSHPGPVTHTHGISIADPEPYRQADPAPDGDSRDY